MVNVSILKKQADDSQRAYTARHSPAYFLRYFKSSSLSISANASVLIDSSPITS